MTPSTSPAAPIAPIDSPNNSAARTATVKGWESMMTCNLDFQYKVRKVKNNHKMHLHFADINGLAFIIPA